MSGLTPDGSESIKSRKFNNENFDPITSSGTSAGSRTEKNHNIDIDDTEVDSSSVEKSKSFLSSVMANYSKWAWVIHLFWGMLLTSWWLAIVIQKDKRDKWLIPTFLWGFLMFRLITWHLPIDEYIMKYVSLVWSWGISARDKYIPEEAKLGRFTLQPRIFAGAWVTIGAILIGTFIPAETEDSSRSDRGVPFFGILVILFILFCSSHARKAINWRTVISGMLMQFIVAVFVLRTSAGYDLFDFISYLARQLLGFSKAGVAFLTDTQTSQQGLFFFSVLPCVIFFVAFIQIFFYFNIVQWFVGKIAVIFFWTMDVSGALAVVASACPFIGMSESTVLVKNLLPYSTDAEIHAMLCAGFATISGSVLASYINLGLNPQALVSSCIMSIPCSLAVSAMRYPETEHSISYGKIATPEETDESKKPRNVLQAFSNGAWLGVIIALNILTNCLCVIAMVSLVNTLLTWFGHFWRINNPDLTLELMLGYLLYPLAWLIGTPKRDCLTMGKLIAIKVTENEYNAFTYLTTVEPYNKMSKRATLIGTYACCGFANFGSVGQQLGVLGSLVPTKARVIAELIFSALISGALSTLLSAAVAAMVIHDFEGFTNVVKS